MDDGLLKKIRVAQFQPGKARIVLEVADRSDYTTSLLSDPPRLIIDIHSKDIHRTQQERSGEDSRMTDPAARQSRQSQRRLAVEPATSPAPEARP